MYYKIEKRKKRNIYAKKIYKGFKFNKFNERRDSQFQFFYEKKYKLISIIFLLFFLNIISSDIFQNIIINLIYNTKKTNEGFLKVHTIHKSKYTKYNYKENIIVYKDLSDNIAYTPITESNTIIKSDLISNDTYWELCDNKTLLDQTKYKRSSKPKISVIIPFYNKNKFSIYLPLRSIQNQSLKDIEIIIVDDGSSENVINDLIEEIKNDNRIILLKHKENKGTFTSRADGVRYASGEYILNLDQDDNFISNMVFEIIYNKIKELNVDILQFSALNYKSKDDQKKMDVTMIPNQKITQPELKTAFLEKIGDKKFQHFHTRMIWDKLVKRKIYLKAIKDLGDEYINHRIFLYEDTLMMFELSQVAYSYYYYDIYGYRWNLYNMGKARDHTSNNGAILAMNQLYFIKLLLYKISPIYDRYHIFKEWGFGYCGSEVVRLDKSEIDLLQETLEVIDELERKYRNTCQELLECVSKIKRHFSLV